MSETILLKSGTIVNEGKSIEADILIKDGIIAKIDSNITVHENHTIVDLSGKLILPGCIDDQVHFREP